MISEAALKVEVDRLLTVLYEKRLAAIEKLTLSSLLSKNPYLYRALGVSKPHELIDQLLAARVSSSDETIFGNSFLEPLAFWSATNANVHGDESRSAHVAGGAGYDLAIESDMSYLAIAVKSGKNIFNSQSTKGQNVEFDGLQARLIKLKKQFRKIIGYGYGRKTTTKQSAIEKVAGQGFWELLTGEADFYLKIARVVGEVAEAHAPIYRTAYDRKSNLLVLDFSNNFLDSDGEISWDKVVAFNSSVAKPARLRRHDEPQKVPRARKRIIDAVNEQLHLLEEKIED
jgi:hypothetical protein